MRALGSDIQIEDHDLREVLPGLLERQAFDRIFFSDEPCTEELEDAAWLQTLGLPCEILETRAIYREKDLPCAIHELPEVFTTFRKLIEARVDVPAPLPAPMSLPQTLFPLGSLGLQETAIQSRITQAHSMIAPGEAAGLQRLRSYVWEADRLRSYKETRNGMLEWDDSSKLSPWLSVGALSPRLICADIRRYETDRMQNASTYWLYFELLWRDYFFWIAKKWGPRLFTGMKSSASRSRSQEALSNWRQGRTGEPFIDANMKELNRTGWMSNRGRQNVANYLVKTLDGDWRQGASFFEEQLIDYDPASNWGNWAYQAGVGQDPRDRRFDPAYQASVYDPEGLYVKRWRE